MKTTKTLLVTLALSAGLLAATGANAALVSRLGGLAYYDDVANLTWLANANGNAGTPMNWAAANAWAAGLNVGGVTGWRLPVAAVCLNAGCTGSEMGNLFYNVLGGTAGNNLLTTHNTNYNLFNSVQVGYYWSATEFSSTSVYAMKTSSLYQLTASKTSTSYSWAVHTGDVGAPVPVPAAAWLLGSGLMGLIGVARRKAA